MSDNRSLLANFVPVGADKWTVCGIGEARLAVAGQGDVKVTATVNGKTLFGIIEKFSPCNKTDSLLTNDPITGTMRGVLYVPGLGINLYSICHATAACLDVFFTNNTVSLSRDGVVIMEGRRSEEKALYRLDIEAEEHNPKTERALNATQVEPLSLWHQRFGHVNFKTLLKMASIETQQVWHSSMINPTQLPTAVGAS